MLTQSINFGGNRYKDFKFRRQFSIDNKYIADFVCLEKKLIIEIDGGQHNENECDKERANYLENIGFKVVRFWNNDILNNMQVCLGTIYRELHTPHPTLSRKGRGILKSDAFASGARGEGTTARSKNEKSFGVRAYEK